MFLQLSHTKIDVFQQSKKLVLECYSITKGFPNDEKFAMVQQIRRAALSVHLNIAEGCSRKSETERKRFFEIARGSVIEVDTAIGIANDLNYVDMDKVQTLGHLIVNTFKQLSAIISKPINS